MRRILGKSFKWFLLAGLIFGMLPGSALAAPAEQDRATTVSVTPLNASVTDCGLLDIYIDVNDVSNLYAVDVRLSFNPAVIEIVSMTPVIDPALLFTAGFTVRNTFNNFTGTIWYAAAQTNPTPPAAGSGHILKLTMRAKATAVTAFTFTYIKLSDPNGVEIPATGVNGSVNASSSVVPNLDIIRLNTTQVQLSWPTHLTTDVSGYELYRSTTPYFNPTETHYQTISNPGSGSVTFNDTVLGNVVTNYFYAARAVCTVGGGSSGFSREVGKFEFQLYETTGTDQNWIGKVLNLRPAGMDPTSASTLATHIQNNSTGNVIVRNISRWSASSQNFSTWSRILPGINNFLVNVKFPYRLEVDVDGASGSVIWAQVGWLPDITFDTYTLYETTGTDQNWILQPLDMTSITTASSLASNIQTQSSAPISVLSTSRFNGASQNFTTYSAGLPFTSFTTRFGYPYRIEVNVNSGFTVTWP